MRLPTVCRRARIRPRPSTRRSSPTLVARPTRRSSALDARRRKRPRGRRRRSARSLSRRPVAPASGAAFNRRCSRSIRRTDVVGGARFAAFDTPRGMASRGALFLVNGDRLRSWKTVGFPQLDAQPFDAAMSGAGILAKAVQSGEADGLGSGSAGADLRRGARRPRRASPCPLLVDGRAVGVLYADTVTRDGAVPSHRGATPLKRWRITPAPCLRSDRAPDGAGAGRPTLGKRRTRRTGRAAICAAAGVGDQVVQRGGRPHRPRAARSAAAAAPGDRSRAAALRRARAARWSALVGQYFQQELVQTLADGDPALLGNA